MTDISGADSPRKIYDVLIVGAGPVGLATAIGLRKRGINNILVIDQTREFRKVGQGLDLLPNGLRALKYIDSEAYEKITEHALRSSLGAKKEPPPLNKRIWSQRNIQG
nr:FAD-dependent oxidoreductase [Acaryochloris sp. IP29b_bin.137]